MDQKEWSNYFNENLEQLRISLSDRQVNQFYQYYELLIKWNSFMNLTAITEPEDIIKKHFIDSLSLIYVIPDLENQESTLIDVGTGAGFPGIPLKIAFPNLKITLLDSLKKRVQFLDEVIMQLELQDITAIHGRAEEFARGPMREAFDFCTSRAVAHLSTLSEYSIPFVKCGGLFISYKSEKITEEFEKAREAIRLLGGDYVKQEKFFLPNSDMLRCLLVISKERKTPLKYPRRAGIPLKEPLK